MRRIGVAYLLASFLASCVAAPPPRVDWRPYKADFERRQTRLAQVAVIAYEGDVQALSAAGVLLGYVQAGPQTPVPQFASWIGGTHAVLIESTSQNVDVGANCFSYSAFGSTRTQCSAVNMNVSHHSFAVWRVEKAVWTHLPESLRPATATRDSPPYCTMPSPAPALGCSYTQRPPGGGAPVYQRLWEHCPKSGFREVSERVPPAMCRLS